MKPRSVRFREDAKQSGMWGAMLLMIAISAVIFAYVCRLHEMFWPMMGLAFIGLGLIFAAIVLFSRMVDKYRASEREAYWEHKRFMDQFQHVHRI